MSDITPVNFVCGTLLLSVFAGFMLSFLNELTEGQGKSISNFFINWGIISTIAFIIIWTIIALIAGLLWLGGAL